ncbi:MAG: ATP-grasp domain-containing protein, partial [Methanobrevibacter sp.]
ESIEGLKGFVGVDLIVKEENDDYIPYLIEINSRFTTPYVGLRKVLNINIGQTIIDLIDGKLSIDDIDDLSFKSSVKFIKDNGQLKIETI